MNRIIFGVNVKVDELKEGMLLAPAPGKGWWTPGFDRDFPLDMKSIRTNNINNCVLGRDPAVYLGKIKFNKAIYGLYTYHQLLYNGSIYLVDGYEFHRRINSL